MTSHAEESGVELSRIKDEEGQGHDSIKNSSTCVSFCHSCDFGSWSSLQRIASITFFRIFPPMRFLANALEGLGKLEALDAKVVDEKGNEVTTQKQGRVNRGDVGFEQLLKVIRENTLYKGEYDNITLVETSAGVKIGDSPDIIRIVVLIKDKEEDRLPYHPFDPDKPIRDLRNWIEDGFRKRLVYWTLIMIAGWIAANSYLLYASWITSP